MLVHLDQGRYQANQLDAPKGAELADDALSIGSKGLRPLRIRPGQVTGFANIGFSLRAGNFKRQDRWDHG
jgi:hypothetical protein